MFKQMWCALGLTITCGVAVAAGQPPSTMPAAAQASAAPATAQVSAPAPKGSLVIIGGGLRADNTAVWQKIVELAGGKGARIAVFPTASESPAGSGRSALENLNRHGAQAFVVPIAPRLPGTDARKAAEDQHIANTVREAGGVFFVGGDQGRITYSLRRSDGRNSAVLDAIWSMYRRGGVIAGTSAGAAIMSTTMFFDPPPVLTMLKNNAVIEGKDITPGLGFIGSEVFIDQHMLIRGRFARMLPVMMAKGYKLGLGIDENTAAVVTPDHEVSVIGYRGAIVLDLSQATTDKSIPDFNLADARISYLDAGDRFNPATRTYTPEADKEKVVDIKPEHVGPVFYTDILGNTAVVNLLERLVDSDQRRAVGLAFEGPGSKSPERGFEFTFTHMPDSEEYQSNRTSDWSVYRVRMDVRPVRIRQPIYTAP